MSPRRIVVGVDSSAGSQLALRWAADEAARTGRELVIINAYDWHVAGARLQVSGGYADALREASEAIVAPAAAAARTYAPQVPVTGEAIVGAPGRVLVSAAEAEDLIVVGSRGRGGFASLLLGSVGRYVATHARGCVAVVRGGDKAAGGPVVVGVDLAGSDNALRVAFEQAKLRGTGIVAVHVYIPEEAVLAYGVMPSVEFDQEREAAYRTSSSEAVGAWADKYPDVPVEISPTARAPGGGPRPAVPHRPARRGRASRRRPRRQSAGRHRRGPAPPRREHHPHRAQRRRLLVPYTR